MEAATSAVRIAIEGCGHGKLDDIYASVKHAAELKKWPTVDLVIICGDFQAVRNAQDLNTMAVPIKYRQIGDFWKYYSGQLRAPYLTIFIGGNHEASGHMRELYYGGWAAPNIYFMGAANVLRLGPLRIAGMSGIWKGFDYRKGHTERLPFSQDEVRSCYHVRELDVRKLLQIRTQVDIGLSHDWPHGVEWLGDHRYLFKIKAHFEEDARNNALGNKAATYVLDRLRPPHWFSGHMHCRYTAVKHFPPSDDSTTHHTPTKDDVQSAVETKNEDEIDLDLEDEPVNATAEDVDLDNASAVGSALNGKSAEESKNNDASTVSQDLRDQLPASFAKPVAPPKPVHLPHPSAIRNTTTQFLALDKLEPNRQFLQLIEVEPSTVPTGESLQRPLALSYDPEWLAVSRVFGDLNPMQAFPHDPGTAHYLPQIEEQEDWVRKNLVTKNRLGIHENFELTAPVHDAGQSERASGMPREYSNPQTKAYCELLDIRNWFDDEEENLVKRWQEQPVDNGGSDYRHRGGHSHRGQARHHGGRGRGSNQNRGRGRGRGHSVWH